jgi:splicing factor 3A subunit 1
MAPAPLVERNDASDNTDFKPPPGVILPPKEFRTLLEKTAGYIVRNGPAFEARIRDSAENNPKLQFVLPDNPYHPFYLWRLEEIKDGRGTDIAAGREGDLAAPKKKQGPAPPPEFTFSARMPNISSVDLEVIKLTAMFVAKNGRSWMTTLSQREARNPQFDFLRPQHSFYQFFSRLVDQYTEILNTEGQQQEAVVAMLEKNIDNKNGILESARKRAEWVKFQEAQKVKKEEEQETEKIAYAQIDWHDFVVVETILFTEADDQTELPPPTSLNDIQSASLEQKAQMSLAPSGMRIEETMPGQEAYYQPPPSQMPPPASYSPAPPASYSPAQNSAYVPPPRTAQEQEEDARIAERTAERQRAEQAQAAARGQGPMRIRNDYVPRAQARRQNVATALCPNCKQQIPFNELEQHMKSSSPLSYSSSISLCLPRSQSRCLIPDGVSNRESLLRVQVLPTCPPPTWPTTSSAWLHNEVTSLIRSLVKLLATKKPTGVRESNSAATTASTLLSPPLLVLPALAASLLMYRSRYHCSILLLRRTKTDHVRRFANCIKSTATNKDFCHFTISMNVTRLLSFG